MDPTSQQHGNLNMPLGSQNEASSNRPIHPLIARLKRKNPRLKEKLHEYTILDRYVKTENDLMKFKHTHYQAKIERLKCKNMELMFQLLKTHRKITQNHII